MKGLNNIAAVLMHGYGKHSTDISVGDSQQAGLVRVPSSITPLRGKGQGILLIIFKIVQLDLFALLPTLGPYHQNFRSRPILTPVRPPRPESPFSASRAF